MKTYRHDLAGMFEDGTLVGVWVHHREAQVEIDIQKERADAANDLAKTQQDEIRVLRAEIAHLHQTTQPRSFDR